MSILRLIWGWKRDVPATSERERLLKVLQKINGAADCLEAPCEVPRPFLLLDDDSMPAAEQFHLEEVNGGAADA